MIIFSLHKNNIEKATAYILKEPHWLWRILFYNFYTPLQTIRILSSTPYTFQPRQMSQVFHQRSTVPSEDKFIIQLAGHNCSFYWLVWHLRYIPGWADLGYWLETISCCCWLPTCQWFKTTVMCCTSYYWINIYVLIVLQTESWKLTLPVGSYHIQFKWILVSLRIVSFQIEFSRKILTAASHNLIHIECKVYYPQQKGRVNTFISAWISHWWQGQFVVLSALSWNRLKSFLHISKGKKIPIHHCFVGNNS